MTNISLNLDTVYKEFLKSIKDKYRVAQIKDPYNNVEVLSFNWELGKSIIEKQKKYSWGSKFLEQLSHDLTNEFSGAKGFSIRNLQFMQQFAQIYPYGITKQVVSQLPWGHAIVLMQKVKDANALEWYIQNTVQNNISRSALIMQIEQGLYEQQRMTKCKLSNFEVSLPNLQSDLAMQTLKNPYKYVESVIIPNFTGYVDKDIILVVYALDGKILFATNLFAKRAGLGSWKNAIGKTIDDLVYSLLHNRLVNRKLNEIRLNVIKHEKAISYIAFINHADGFHAHQSVHEPIFDQSGQVVASRVIADKFRKTDIIDYLAPDFEQFIKYKPLTVKLTQRQHEILFLLSSNFSQYEIGEILGVSRGTVSQVIAKICEKFDIGGQSGFYLIKKAREFGIDRKIPGSLLQPKIIVLNNNEDFIYNY